VARDVSTVQMIWIGKAAIQNIFHEDELVVIEAFLRCHFTRVDRTCLVLEMTHMMSSESNFQFYDIFFGVACLNYRR
jgi:hypothetical protein